MGSLSDYSENKALDFVLGGQAFPRVATLFGSAHTATLNDNGTGTEVSGGGYTRKSIANNATNFPAAASRSKALAIQQDFPSASGAWGTVTDFGLWDAASSGNLILADISASSQAVGSGGTLYVPGSSGLIVSLGGDISTYLGNALLDHILGGPDYTPPASVHFALFVSGVEVSGNGYSRKSVTNDSTNFPAAVGGVKTLAVAQEFNATPSGSWGTIDEVRIYDASAGGNVLWSKAVTVPRAVGVNAPARFSAGSLSFSLS